ncbi:DUF4296 domain-containing protein [Hydrotalea sp.]|uniref:DUF4296 domain-containing protein n=1 Tax=Hydrotalea sp. TaxID=2881279 RepID=UPI003D0EF38C
MKKFLILICFFIALAACNHHKSEMPILNFDSMKVVMWDLLNANEWNNMKAGQDTVFRKMRDDRKQFEQVFYWHHITKSSFYHSLSYYEQHPDKMKKLIDSLSAYGKRLTMHPVDSLKLHK